MDASSVGEQTPMASWESKASKMSTTPQMCNSCQVCLWVRVSETAILHSTHSKIHCQWVCNSDWSMSPEHLLQECFGIGRLWYWCIAKHQLKYFDNYSAINFNPILGINIVLVLMFNPIFRTCDRPKLNSTISYLIWAAAKVIGSLNAVMGFMGCPSDFEGKQLDN